MRFYVLVEGAQTEKQLYRAWLGHCFPQLREVEAVEAIVDDSFFLIAGKGYPSYMRRIPAALEDAAVQGGVEHLFICVDAEQKTLEDKRQEINGLLNQARFDLQKRHLLYTGQIHLIVADCCVETWLLGHHGLLPRNPSSEPLRTYRSFYDVSALDPEKMPAMEGFATRASFHHEYLRELFRSKDKTYTKTHPGIARERNYLVALKSRCMSSRDLKSFGFLWDTWASLGATV